MQKWVKKFHRYWKCTISKKVSSAEKIYKYFFGYLYNDHKVKPLHIMLPKTRFMLKVMMNKLNGCIFWGRWLIRKTRLPFRSGIKKNLIASQICNKNFKTKIKFHSDEVTNFCNKNNAKADSSYASLAVTSLDSAL